MNNVITNKEIFDTCIKDFMDKNKDYEALVDYFIFAGGRYYADYDIIEVLTSCLTPYFLVSYGGSEGMYMDIRLHASAYFKSEKDVIPENIPICTFKMLETSDDAYRALSKLGTELCLELNNYISAHQDLLNRTGYTIKSYMKKGLYPLLQSKATDEFLESEFSGESAVLLVCDKSEHVLEVHWSECNGGWDYTLYNPNLTVKDGGVVEDEDGERDITDVTKEIVTEFLNHIFDDSSTLSLKALDEKLFWDVVDSQEVSCINSYGVESLDSAKKVIQPQLKVGKAFKYEVVDQRLLQPVYTLDLTRSCGYMTEGGAL